MTGDHEVQNFDGFYDYLVWKHPPTHLSRPSASVKVKYHYGHDWTVRDKRISLIRAVQDDTLSVRCTGLNVQSRLLPDCTWFVLAQHRL